MVQEEHEFENDSRVERDQRRASLVAAEITRSKRRCAPPVPAKEKMPILWQVFGGTIVSVVAVIMITVFNQMANTETDLRRDINQVQAELVRKEDLNLRSTAQWNGIKDLQRRLEDLNHRLQVLSERLAAIESAHRPGEGNFVGGK